MSNRLLAHLPLLLMALICTLFIYFIHEVSSDRIRDNFRRAALQDINAVLVPDYDNDVYNDVTMIDVPGHINPDGNIEVYHAKKNERNISMALRPVVAKGYSGPVRLILGLSVDGEVTGIRVIDHNETPGFGADLHQDKSDWLKQFKGAALAKYMERDWATIKDGGKFDQLSGATITSRAVINKIRDVLVFYEEEKQKFNHIRE